MEATTAVFFEIPENYLYDDNGDLKRLAERLEKELPGVKFYILPPGMKAVPIRNESDSPAKEAELERRVASLEADNDYRDHVPDARSQV